MKKLIILFAAVIFAGPLLKTGGQTVINSSGLASTYEDAESSYLAEFQGKELTKEQEDRILKNLSPEMKSKLEEVKKLNKDKYYQLLRTVSSSGYLFASVAGSEISSGNSLAVYEDQFREQKEKVKKQKELEIDVELYALKLKSADNANQKTIKKELQSSLSQLFDIRESQKQAEVKQLEKRLQELKESLQARKQNKEEIIQRRIQELQGD